jgi:dihydroneopterin triphosphate diphosphatase
MPQIVSRIVDVCAFRFPDDAPEYLVLRRAPDERLYPLLWQFVSGTIEEGERALDAALRELREETALPPLALWVAPHVNMFYDLERDSVNCNPLFVARVPPATDPRLSSEHIAFAWLRFPEATKALVWPEQRSALDTIHRFIVSGEDAARYSLINPG